MKFHEYCRDKSENSWKLVEKEPEEIFTREPSKKQTKSPPFIVVSLRPRIRNKRHFAFKYKSMSFNLI